MIDQVTAKHRRCSPCWKTVPPLRFGKDIINSRNAKDVPKSTIAHNNMFPQKEIIRYAHRFLLLYNISFPSEDSSFLQYIQAQWPKQRSRVPCSQTHLIIPFGLYVSEYCAVKYRFWTHPAQLSLSLATPP